MKFYWDGATGMAVAVAVAMAMATATRTQQSHSNNTDATTMDTEEKHVVWLEMRIRIGNVHEHTQDQAYAHSPYRRHRVNFHYPLE